MDVLWTPWRYEYIVSAQKQGCIFCRAGKAREEEELFLFGGESSFILLNRYPYNNGHLLIAPYEHIPSLTEAGESILYELMELAAKGEEVLTKVYTPDGFNLGMNIGGASGAGYKDHLHFHVVPRWEGDTNFLSVSSETRIVPETPQQTHEKLVSHFARE